MPHRLDHPKRYSIVNELHARPFPMLEVPCQAVYLAFKEPVDAYNRKRTADREHLLALLDRHASAHPAPGAANFSGMIGRHFLKWDTHTEFVTYCAFGKGLSDRPFDPHEAEVFPEDWQNATQGKRLVSLLVRIEHMPENEAEIERKAASWFVDESLTISKVIDGAAIVAGDFQIDPAGHMRFAVFVRPGTGPRRVGRLVQQLCELETYRSMSMLGLMRARELGAALNALDPKLTALVMAQDTDAHKPDELLHKLLEISAGLESLAMQTTFRFGATQAYETIVHQRIGAMREQRFMSRQTFHEFMVRRYDPAMRTTQSTEKRLERMIERAERVADLLRTRVDVERSAQNQKLLASMDERADVQLRLQRTVEGLSVVAISYYAVSLAGYIAYPLLKPLEASKEMVMLGLTPLVVFGVWMMVRRIRNSFH